MSDIAVSSGKTGNRVAAYRMAAALMVVLALSACGNKQKAASQSIVRINDDEITVHQLNAELERVNSPAVSKKDVLDGLIARQLLIDQAEKKKIDRDPRVMQAIERAKEQILAQAYLQTKMNNLQKPSENDIRDFYEKNPQLFAQRKQFDTRELNIDTRDLSPELVAKMNSAHSLDEVQSWLQAHQVKFTPVDATRSTAELPAEVTKAIAKMAPGSLFTVKQGDKSQLIELQEIRNVPLTLDVARPKIVEFLMLQKSKEAADAEISRLRAAAKIEYLNKSEVALQDKPAAKPTSPVAAGETKVNAPLTDVERGISNLK
ncbi:MAG TPA: EpsD family peptidyl-prolyl cis-trans isomerase [Oxalicibacterium sp.]|nr:EpsD family peptidyl-prolyl cis-trans isomerase [Oxalicibacterium sp.]